MGNQASEFWSRRQFVQFMGYGALAASLPASALLKGCATTGKSVGALGFTPLKANLKDAVTLVDGLTYDVVAKWEDPINSTEKFGTNNDFIAVRDNALGANDLMLCVNHEYPNPILQHGYFARRPAIRKESEVRKEQLGCGMSVIRVRRGASNSWSMVKDDSRNRMVSGRSKIAFSGDYEIEGSRHAIGTMGNCGGGTTPWGTVLTCEEQFADFYSYSREERKKRRSYYGWETVDDFAPEHYGWVVEINPQTGRSMKHIEMGRFGHESATVTIGKDGRAIVYSGDDSNDRCLYKFLARYPGSLEYGTLYVADLPNGKWIPLVREEHRLLRERFKNQKEVMIHAREAAELVGGTKLDRPEDIEVDPNTGAVYISLTNRKPRNYYGSILRVEEKGGDHQSMEFGWRTFLAGGKENGFACPDNLAFDPRGNLWMTTDISGSSIGKGHYEGLGNNSLYVIPMSGPEMGRAIRVASSPPGAEFTGPSFSPDGHTLFLSVQHPGDPMKTPEDTKSHWPLGGNETPRSSVIAIRGSTLERISGLS